MPWGYPPHVEQDLVLARLMVDIARHEALSGQLAFKGGTCLHKLWMPEPWRYSEDLDYTLIGNIKPDNLRDALKEIVHKAGFTSADWRTSNFISGLAHVSCDGFFLDGSQFRLKIDVQLTPGELPPLLQERFHSVESPGFQGEARIVSFTAEEILASKVAAAYGRSKPRDIFDIWAALEAGVVTPQGVAERFCRYMPETWTAFLCARSLYEKLEKEWYLDGLNRNLKELERPNGVPEEVLRRTAELVDACSEANVPPQRWRQVIRKRKTAVGLLKGWSPNPRSQPSVSSRLAPPRLEPKKPKPPPTKRTRIIGALVRDRSASYDEIAASVGASRSYVAQLARERGLQR